MIEPATITRTEMRIFPIASTADAALLPLGIICQIAMPEYSSFLLLPLLRHSSYCRRRGGAPRKRARDSDILHGEDDEKNRESRRACQRPEGESPHWNPMQCKMRWLGAIEGATFAAPANPCFGCLRANRNNDTAAIATRE